jgi:cbb3-type cytochrome oxidase subunit 3
MKALLNLLLIVMVLCFIFGEEKILTILFTIFFICGGVWATIDKKR